MLQPSLVHFRSILATVDFCCFRTISFVVFSVYFNQATVWCHLLQLRGDFQLVINLSFSAFFVFTV